MTISYMQILRIRHNDQNIHRKVQPHSHPQDVVFQLNNYYSVTNSRSGCNQLCKPQVHSVPGVRNINRLTSKQTSIKMYLKSVWMLLTHSKLVHSQCPKYKKAFL